MPRMSSAAWRLAARCGRADVSGGGGGDGGTLPLTRGTTDLRVRLRYDRSSRKVMSPLLIKARP
jgi:hypothetical protein